MQRDDRVKLLKVEIEDEYMKDIHELISPSLKKESIPLVFSLISLISRVRATDKYCNKLMSMVDMIYLETSLLHSLWDYAVIIASFILNHTTISSGRKTSFELWMGYTDSMEHLHVTLACLGLRGLMLMMRMIMTKT